jgi:hypothetical protein
VGNKFEDLIRRGGFGFEKPRQKAKVKRAKFYWADEGLARRARFAKPRQRFRDVMMLLFSAVGGVLVEVDEVEHFAEAASESGSVDHFDHVGV